MPKNFQELKTTGRKQDKLKINVYSLDWEEDRNTKLILIFLGNNMKYASLVKNIYVLIPPPNLTFEFYNHHHNKVKSFFCVYLIRCI